MRRIVMTSAGWHGARSRAMGRATHTRSIRASFAAFEKVCSKCKLKCWSVKCWHLGQSESRTKKKGFQNTVSLFKLTWWRTLLSEYTEAWNTCCGLTAEPWHERGREIWSSGEKTVSFSKYNLCLVENVQMRTQMNIFCSLQDHHTLLTGPPHPPYRTTTPSQMENLCFNCTFQC